MGKISKPKAQQERTVPLLAGEDRSGPEGANNIFFAFSPPKLKIIPILAL